MKTNFSLFILSFTLLSSFAEARSGLDVNDVSFLLPMKEGLPVPALNLESQNLIPEKIYKQVIHFEYPDLSTADLPYVDAKEMARMSNWFVTSARVDHCGEVFDLNSLTDPLNGEKMFLAKRGDGCQPRLRLVAQPFNISNQPVATALHLLYKIDEQTLSTFSRDLLQLKDQGSELGFSTTGIPLSVHPALALEAKNGGVLLSSMIKKILEETIASSSLEIVTLSVRGHVNEWKMVAGYVQQGRWTRFVTEFSKQFYSSKDHLLTGVEEIDCDELNICVMHPSYQPVELKPAGTVLTEIFQNKPEMRVIQVPGHRTPGIHVKAEILDNPDRTHFFNTNCMSCHQASNLRDREKLNTEFQSSPGVSPFVQKKYLNNQTNNVLSFAYFGRIPRISTRVAADSVVVADALNKRMGLSNPAPFIKDLNQYWNCIVTQKEVQKCSQTKE